MTKAGLFLFSLLSFSALSFGALSPLAQSAIEIETILKDPRLHLLGSREVVNEIYRREEGYIICTDHYFLKVGVHRLPSEGLGPARFELEFHPPQEYLP